MKKDLIPVIGVVAALVIIVVAYAALGGGPSKSGRLNVVASFYPLAFFAQEIGGESVEVDTVTSAGTEPHDFEPTAKDIVGMQSAQLFLYNGSGLDAWAEKLDPSLRDKGVITLKMSDQIELIAAEEDEDHEEDASTHSETEQSDPHFWLDPVLAQKEVEVIRESLIQTDPANTEVYRQNTEALLGRLGDLHRRYESGLSACESRDIVTSHAAFGYLAKRYDLAVTPIAGLSPDEEPSAKQLADISDLVTAKSIKYIFTETLVSPKLAETIAREVGAETLLFNPIEGVSAEESQAGANYFSIMESNLTNLKKALGC